MTDALQRFADLSVKIEHVTGQNVLEVGSRNVNGSLRERFMGLKANSYFGIDVVEGDGVDQVISIKDFANTTDKKFGYIVCTDMIEHCECWWDFFQAIPKLLNNSGRIIFSAPPENYDIHLYDSDFWRLSNRDIVTIFRCLFDLENSAGNHVNENGPGDFNFINIRFDLAAHNKNKRAYDFILNNLRVKNILVGDKVSKKEWLEMNY